MDKIILTDDKQVYPIQTIFDEGLVVNVTSLMKTSVRNLPKFKGGPTVILLK